MFIRLIRRKLNLVFFFFSCYWNCYCYYDKWFYGYVFFAREIHYQRAVNVRQYADGERTQQNLNGTGFVVK